MPVISRLIVKRLFAFVVVSVEAELTCAGTKKPTFRYWPVSEPLPELLMATVPPLKTKFAVVVFGEPIPQAEVTFTVPPFKL